MASPVASKGVATAPPATGTIRATSAVALNGSATAPQPARDVQISNRANTRIGCPRACKGSPVFKRADRGFSAMPPVNCAACALDVEEPAARAAGARHRWGYPRRRTDQALMLERPDRALPASCDEQRNTINEQLSGALLVWLSFSSA